MWRCRRVGLGLALGLLCAGCAHLKPYERVYVSDPEMQLGLDPGKAYQQYIYSIREGAAPPGTVKGSGGCGCN